MTGKLRVSLAMASLNEQEAIGPMIDEARRHAGDLDLEIVLVDSSTDRTPEIAREKGARVITQPKGGHGKALRAAILACEGDVIVTSDCDCTYPMAMLPVFAKMVAHDGYDLVSGNRMHGVTWQSMPLANRAANMAFAGIVRGLYGLAVHDVTTGMFGMSRRLAQAIPWETNYAFPSEILIRAKLGHYKWVEVPIDYTQRVGEVTLNRWRSGKAYLRAFAKYRFNLPIPPEKL